VAFDRIQGTILGGWWIDCRYTDRRWLWLGRLLFVGDAITAGSRRTTRGKSASIAETSAGTSCQAQSDHSGIAAPIVPPDSNTKE
jgi:hypothetical protein